MAKYEILIKDESTTGAGGTEATEVVSPKSSDKKDIAKAVSQVSAGVALARQVFSLPMDIAHRELPDVTKDKIDFAMTLGQQALGIGVAFAAGGVVGGVMAISAVGLSYAKKIEQFNYAAREESIALGVARQRAGPSYNRSRTG